MEMIEEEQYNFHVNHYCKHRLVPCIDCDDMFPLSLFTEHLEVCRAQKPLKNEEIEEEGSALDNLFVGLGQIGSTLFSKGL